MSHELGPWSSEAVIDAELRQDGQGLCAAGLKPIGRTNLSKEPASTPTAAPGIMRRVGFATCHVGRPLIRLHGVRVLAETAKDEQLPDGTTIICAFVLERRSSEFMVSQSQDLSG